MRKLSFAIALAFVLVAQQLHAATVETTMSLERAVSAEESGDGAPAAGTVYEFSVTSDADILRVGDVNIDFDLYQNGTGSDTAPPNPAFVAVFPSLGADSWITTPGDTAIAGGGFGVADSAWFDSSNDGGQTDFLFARLTTTEATTGTFSGVVSVAGTSGPEVFPFSFDIGGGGGDIVPTPGVGPLDLGAIVAAGGLIEDAITFTGGDPSSVDFSNQSIPNLFFANIDGSSVDIGVDLALATTFKAGTEATADLAVGGAGGPFNYAVTAIIPEPTSLALFGMAMIGLVAGRRS